MQVTSRPPMLHARGLSKSYAGIQALRDVSFDVAAGEVHALVGENGAGKSTLIRILTGALQPDAGTLEVAGEQVAHHDPLSARRRGIAAIYQQPALFSHLSVAENLLMGLESSAWRRIDRRARRHEADVLLGRVGAHVDPETPAGALSMAEQQLVEIARALGRDARIVIMDEPTASLTSQEVDRLLDTVRALRSRGAGIVYISHRLDEVFALADRITVLRDGQRIDTRRASDIDRATVIRLMIGRDVPERTWGRASAFDEASADGRGLARRPSALRVDRAAEAPLVDRTAEAVPHRSDSALEVHKLGCAAAGIEDISFALHAGEILGLGGLVGAGRTELARTLFGITPADRGRIVIEGREHRIASPADAIAAGLAYLPEDRRRHGVIGELRIASNLSLASLPRLAGRFGWLARRAERERAGLLVRELDVRPPAIDAPVRTLSGGNQQKVALGRWLMTGPRVLVLDEPTQGVDIGAKAEIHRHIERLAAEGAAILVISSDLPELLALSDRLLVMRAGRIAGELARADVTPEAVLRLALGEHAA